MGAVLVVGLEEPVQVGLELGQFLIPGLSSLDSEVLVEQGAVEAFEVAVALRAADLGGAVFDAFELEEKVRKDVCRACRRTRVRCRRGWSGWEPCIARRRVSAPCSTR